MLEGVKELFRNSTALMSFFSIFAAGMIFTLFSLVLGGDHDHGGEFHGDAEHGEAGHGHGPGLLSIRGISLMATGFGAMAFLVMYYTRQVLVASVSGLGFGWVFALAGITMMRVFIRQQGSSMIQAQDFIGATGEVTTGVPERGLGEVRLTVNGVTMTKSASSLRGRAIPSGTPVRVVRLLGGTITVEEVPQE